MKGFWQRPQRSRFAAGIVALMLTLVACDQTAPKTDVRADARETTPESPNAGECALLTNAAVASATGQEEPEVRSTPHEGGCQWDASGSSVIVVRSTHGADGSFRNIVDGAETSEEVGGIGDKAAWIPDLMTLAVVKDDTYFHVQVFRVGDPAQEKEVAISLAQLIAPKV